MTYRKHSFTLVELMLVIMLIAALSGIALGITGYVHRRSDDIKMTTLIANLKQLNESYKAKYGFYVPAVSGKLDVEYSQFPANASILQDSYEAVKKVHKNSGSSAVVLDIWGNAIRYRVPGKFNTGSFDLYSVGADGVVGSSDDTKTSPVWKKAGKADDIANFTNRY